MPRFGQNTKNKTMNESVVSQPNLFSTPFSATGEFCLDNETVFRDG
jgi:hypothetical protein